MGEAMIAQPQEQHRWLEQWVGEWRYEAEATMGPDPPVERATGTERIRSLGGLWIVCEGTGTMPGAGSVTSLMTLGYDPGRGRFRGTWCGSMMTDLWIYDGTLDAAGRVLSLDTEGPSFTGSGTAPYRDVVELVSRDERVMSSHTMGEDGQWRRFMTMRLARTR